MCPFCERFAHVTTQWAGKITDRETNIVLMQGVSTCNNCGRASLGTTYEYGHMSNDSKSNFDASADASITWYPRIGASPDFLDVPKHIARAAKEAHAAESISSYMSAVLMARTVVEATAKAKGIAKGNLVEKIDALAAQGSIRADTKDAAHEIRHFGNDMAHGDIEDLPDADDVRDVLVLMDEVLSEVFQGPAKTARLKARRAGSKGPSVDGDKQSFVI